MLARSNLVVCVVVGAAALAGGCGGGGDSPAASERASTGGSPTAKTAFPAGTKVPAEVVQEYAKIGAAIYQIGDNYGQALQAAKSGAPEAEASKYFAGLADTTRKVARDLQRATPEASLEKRRSAIVAGLKRMAADLDALATAKSSGAADAAIKRITADAAEVNTPLNALAKAIRAPAQ